MRGRCWHRHGAGRAPARPRHEPIRARQHPAAKPGAPASRRPARSRGRRPPGGRADGPARHPASPPGHEGGGAVGRKPAEGHPGEVACPRGGRTAARRADPGHRRGRQGADPRPGARFRAARGRRDRRFQRPRRARPVVRFRGGAAPGNAGGAHRAERPERDAPAHGDRRMKVSLKLDLQRLAGQAPLLTLLLLCLLTALMTDRFLSPLNLTNILVQSSIMVIIAKLGVNPFITTLGMMVLMRGIVFLVTGGAPVGDEGLPAAFLAFGSSRFLGVHYLVWVPAILLAALSWLLHATPYGRRVFATGGGREAAYLSGVRVERIIASTYVWCGALAGLAGVMLAARLQSGQPTAGEFYELTAIAAVVLGGAALHGGEGTLYKTIIGVFIMIVLGNSLNLLNVDSYWQRVAVGAVIIAAAAADRLRSRH